MLEVRREDGEFYPLNSLYQLCYGLLIHLRDSGQPEVYFFQQPQFHDFRKTLDTEMKRLNSTGKYINKHRAEPVTEEMEEHLWELGLLGSSSPATLWNTLVYMVGLYFALRSGNEHRRLCFFLRKFK